MTSDSYGEKGQRNESVVEPSYLVKGKENEALEK